MSLASLLNQTVTIYNRTADPSGYDRYGNPIFTTGTDYPARFEKVTTTTLSPTGETVNIVGKVFVRGDVSVASDDKLVYSGRTYKVVTIDDMVVGSGSSHHQTLKVTDWV